MSYMWCHGLARTTVVHAVPAGHELPRVWRPGGQGRAAGARGGQGPSCRHRDELVLGIFPHCYPLPQAAPQPHSPCLAACGMPFSLLNCRETRHR